MDYCMAFHMIDAPLFLTSTRAGLGIAVMLVASRTVCAIEKSLLDRVLGSRPNVLIRGLDIGSPGQNVLAPSRTQALDVSTRMRVASELQVGPADRSTTESNFVIFASCMRKCIASHRSHICIEYSPERTNHNLQSLYNILSFLLILPPSQTCPHSSHSIR